MKWTNKTPKIVGWYWYKDSMTDSPLIGQVTKESKDFWFSDNNELAFRISAEDEDTLCFWSDAPIAEPE